MVHALKGHAGAVHLAQAIGVVGFDPEQFLNLAAGLLRVRFGADECLAQAKLFAGHAIINQHFVQMQQIAGRSVNPVSYTHLDVYKRQIPNLITSLRILLVAPFLWLLLQERYGAALLLFVIAGISDALDGFLAKYYGCLLYTSRCV